MKENNTKEDLCKNGEPNGFASCAPDEEISLETKNENMKQEIASLKDQLLRAVAEQENIRKRSEREKKDMAKYSIAQFAKDLVAIADNCERALESVATNTEDKNLSAIVEGVTMIESELLKVLERHGVKKHVPKVGEKFDPNLHQAMFEVEHDDTPQGHIAQIMQAGYSHHERLLRPSMVGVSKGKKA